MSFKYKLAVFGNEPSVIDFMHGMLSEVLGQEVELYKYFLGDECDTTIPVVLTGHKGYYTQAKRAFPNSIIIPAEKILTGHNLEKVIMLPAGKRVLVVSQPQIAVLETIKNLTDMGINHLEYIPFVSDEQTPSDIDTAISPGLVHLCPKQICNIIDVGPRTISVESFNQVLMALGLSSNYLDSFYNVHKKPLVQGSGQLAEKSRQIESLTEEKNLILNTIQDGVLSVGADKIILSLNSAMERIIGKNKEELLGKLVTDVITPISSVADLIYDIDENFSAQITIKGTKYVYNSLITDNNKFKTYLFMFKKASQVGILAEEAHKELGKKGYVAKYTFDDIWGDTYEIAELKENARLFTKNNVTILISGESGTGKELLAQAIHNSSERKNAPFLPVNFAALPESLIESELFGYEDGAFTGAKKGGKPGYFEMAKGGTIFIDEIGDMPLALQPRLLRILQEREVIRLGGNKVIPIDVRIIAATNVDLLEQVKTHKFRADLYYRLNVLSLNTVPLRECKSNIEQILRKYLVSKYNFDMLELSADVRNIFLEYNWPGNIRELFNIGDYIFYTNNGKHYINANNIPKYLLNATAGKSVLENNKGGSYATGTISMKSIMRSGNEAEIISVILQAIENSERKNIGKKILLENIQARGYEITEHYLKIYLKKMAETGLIEVGSTKQGTKITAAGLEYLQNFFK